MKKIKVLVVEDEIIIGKNIASKIEEADSLFEVVGMAGNGKEALELIRIHNPRVIFTDICMPTMDGMELAHQLHQFYPGVIVVIVSGFSDFSYAQQAIKHGVFNYILKPVEKDSLAEILYDIRKSIVSVTHSMERKIIYSDFYNMEQYDASYYQIGLLCIGNLVYDATEEEVIQFYDALLGKIPWKEIVEKAVPEGCPWYLSDEHVFNQKVLVLKYEKSQVEIEKVLKKINQLLSEFLAEVTIHIVYSQNQIPREEIWGITKQLRNLLKHQLKIEQNQIYILEREKDYVNSEIIEIVKMKLKEYVKAYLKHGNMQQFLEDINCILIYMIHNQATQDSVEKVSIYMLRLLEFSKQKYDLEIIQNLQEELLKKIGVSLTANDLVENLMTVFKKFGRYIENWQEQKIEDQICEFVDTAYLEIESLEQVADKFGYNYAYLSRLFKKKKGMPMNKYITEKKMKMAISIMESNKELTINEISEICGYKDYRYFSRVFKNETGMAPSEYKEGL
ncbi:MAG TPA: hypothetical protein DHW61_03300 [Lachnoclostridium phytofermentans]|uniref:Stage 0 sporulation protein A homolog n=1 Tax=Lachnoclostridium phytofermentans TaxID=66219 RepID=A0A3D2X2U7_9FIRM|nr:response regulator [Lachnoclostridium sp.]HCL01432.1 hypothetical protein [Lachnoclostridium phytofermentans]